METVTSLHNTKNVFWGCVFLFTVHGVCGVGVMERKVFEGDYLTLKTQFIEVQKNGLIDWKVNRTRIASVNKGTGRVEYTDDKLIMFGDTLTVDQNGFFTIWSVRHRHYGEYEVESSSSAGTNLQTFKVTVKDSQISTNEVNPVAATEGTTVTLQSDLELQKQDLILWRFGAEGHLIAKWDVEDGQILYYGGPDGRFRDRLQMDQKNGSLTIKNIRTEDAGEYNLKIVGDRKTLFTRFSVAVSASGLSPGGIAGIVLTILLLGIAAAAAAIWYYCYKTFKLKKLIRDISEQIKKLSKISVELQQLSNQLEDVSKNKLNDQKISKEELSNFSEKLQQLSTTCKELPNISAELLKLYKKIDENLLSKQELSNAGEREQLNISQEESLVCTAVMISEMGESASPNSGPQNKNVSFIGLKTPFTQDDSHDDARQKKKVERVVSHDE